MIPPVVSQEQWQAQRHDVVLVDVRRDTPARRGAQAYADGHLPGAVLVDLDRDLAAPPGPEVGRHPLPTPQAFADALSAAGIGDGDPVVAYDDEDGVIAARLVWMLRATGRAAALLDGGLRAARQPLQRGEVTRPRASCTPVPWPADAVAGLEEAVGDGHVLLDARPRARFLGTPDPLDPRPGHVPGARSLPCRDNLDADGLLLPDDVLRRRFADVGVDGTAAVVSSCGSGVTACHTLLVMEHLGLGAGRLWPGSWSQYAADPDRPAGLDAP